MMNISGLRLRLDLRFFQALFHDLLFFSDEEAIIEPSPYANHLSIGNTTAHTTRRSLLYFGRRGRRAWVGDQRSTVIAIESITE